MGIRKNRTSFTLSFFFAFVYFENLKLYYNFKKQNHENFKKCSKSNF